MFRYGTPILLVTCLVAAYARSQDKPTTPASKTNVQVLMRDKLTHMQRVLEGMVTENYEMISQEAKMLHMIGQAASWQSIDTEAYRTHSSQYARLTSSLTKAAESRNRDAVLVQYLQLTSPVWIAIRLSVSTSHPVRRTEAFCVKRSTRALA